MKPLTIAHVTRDLGVHKEALRQWVRQAEADGRPRSQALLPTEVREELVRLRKGRGAAASERDLEGRLRLFRAGARPEPATVTRYVEERRDAVGVEPICGAIGVPVSTCYAHRSRKPSSRELQDRELVREIHAARDGYVPVYGCARPGRSCAGAAS